MILQNSHLETDLKKINAFKIKWCFVHASHLQPMQFCKNMLQVLKKSLFSKAFRDAQLLLQVPK